MGACCNEATPRRRYGCSPDTLQTRTEISDTGVRHRPRPSADVRQGRAQMGECDGARQCRWPSPLDGRLCWQEWHLLRWRRRPPEEPGGMRHCEPRSAAARLSEHHEARSCQFRFRCQVCRGPPGTECVETKVAPPVHKRYDRRDRTCLRGRGTGPGTPLSRVGVSGGPVQRTARRLHFPVGAVVSNLPTMGPNLAAGRGRVVHRLGWVAAGTSGWRT